MENKELFDKIWEKSKSANEYPKDWYVIPTLEVIEILKVKGKTNINTKK